LGKEEFSGKKEASRPRILLVEDGIGHSTGYHVVARGLVEAGFEVILGGYMIAREIVEAAIQESVDCIGYRIMDGAPDILVSDLFTHMNNKEIRGLPVVIGGIIPAELHGPLQKLGVRGIHTPGSKIEEISASIREILEKGRTRQNSKRGKNPTLWSNQ
jgi:methylmalonyl-CoA mutase C-terminal domain/subunit